MKKRTWKIFCQSDFFHRKRKAPRRMNKSEANKLAEPNKKKSNKSARNKFGSISEPEKNILIKKKDFYKKENTTFFEKTTETQKFSLTIDEEKFDLWKTFSSFFPITQFYYYQDFSFCNFI